MPLLRYALPSRLPGAWAALTALAMLLPGATALSGQQPARDLDRFVERIAAAWGRGNVGPIVAHASPEGLTLELGDAAVGPLTSRQAAAELRRLFERHETVQVRVGTTRVVGGSPPRAFGELTWRFRVEGTTIPETRTVFFALVEEDGAWRLTQIRVLR